MKRRLFGYSIRETDRMIELLRAENDRLAEQVRHLQNRQRQLEAARDARIERAVADRLRRLREDRKPKTLDEDTDEWEGTD